MNFHLEETIKLYGIPSGRVIIVDGEQGAGKTSLVTAMLRLDFAHHKDDRLNIARAHYRHKGLDLLKLPDTSALKSHLYYSNVEIALKGTLATAKPENKTHNVTADDICLPDGTHPAMYFPWGSIIFIQEGSDKWHSHDWQKLAKTIRPWLKYLRQANLTLIIDTHNDSDIAKQLRDLFTDEYYVDNHLVKPARFFGLIKSKITWYFNYSTPQKMHSAERRGENIKAYSQNVSFRTKDGVFEAYDSYSGEILFLRGIYNYGFATRTHPKVGYSASEIENYCVTNGIIPTENSDEPAKETPAQDEKAGT